jgi:AcrR family transcriptional regulator
MNQLGLERWQHVVQSPAVLNDKAVQILQGAMQEFLQNGYAGTSMDKVAATAGVSKPTVYNYFKDKEGLFRALIQYVAQARCAQVMGDGNLEGRPEVVIRRLITNAIESELHDLDYQNLCAWWRASRVGFRSWPRLLWNTLLSPPPISSPTTSRAAQNSICPTQRRQRGWCWARRCFLL